MVAADLFGRRYVFFRALERFQYVRREAVACQVRFNERDAIFLNNFLQVANGESGIIKDGGPL